MSTTVHDTLKDAGDNPLIGATVEIALVVGQDTIANGYVTTLGYSISSTFEVTTDNSGFWKAQLTPNALITPSGTAYRLRYKRKSGQSWEQVLFINAPNDTADHWVFTILTAAPDAPGPSGDLTAYQLKSEKGAANGYAGLGASGVVQLTELASGSPDNTKFLRGDGTWAVPPGTSSPLPTQFEMLDKRNVSGAVSLDVSSFNVFDLTLIGNVTSLQVINEDGTHAWSLTLILRQDGTGGRTVNWGGAFKWPNALGPQVSTAAGKIDAFTMVTTDGGSTWLAFQAGQAMA